MKEKIKEATCSRGFESNGWSSGGSWKDPGWGAKFSRMAACEEESFSTELLTNQNLDVFVIRGQNLGTISPIHFVAIVPSAREDIVHMLFSYSIDFNDIVTTCNGIVVLEDLGL